MDASILDVRPPRAAHELRASSSPTARSCTTTRSTTSASTSPTRRAVIRAYELAKAAGVTVQKPPRTTWRGTPLHELWLEDPDGNSIEIYARLTDEELAGKPADLEPTALA